MRPRLALVPGEPAGVGPELCVRIAQQPHAARIVVLADPDTLLKAAHAIGLPLRLRDPDADAGIGELAVLPLPQPESTLFGTPDPVNARSVIDALLLGARHCLDGLADALVTGPVHKAAINAAGIAYSGTTELLAAQAGCEVVMMLASVSSRPLRVALATTHLPLRKVPDAITRDGLTRTLRILVAALRQRFAISHPRIAVLGLNPHAGEAGYLGREEIEVIAPVLEQLRSEGMHLLGPLPADTAFLPRQLQGCDAVLAMYHDQGLPVLKYAGFEDAVNITLGLPYPRVAVDHGTALELAGRGLADPSSLLHAIAVATAMAQAARTGDSTER
ncbi:MAG TPA: 4-hydroxythreonine-4-phosphate dehydrogenase PdxA [Xanthomonadaceae bacterium]|jgi:4-hydroxythreonine-4-phosphate dehydrogenase|nr:4-hydroxythreonine-4-phosphate dehydrogenase PdxA [Xanthomonadaceae bacterium]